MVLRSFRSGRSRAIFLGVLALIVGLEVLAVQVLAGTLPQNVRPDDAKLVLQSIISVDGVLLGFCGIVFSTFLSREKRQGRMFNLLTSIIATVTLYLLSVLNAFYGILAVGGGNINGELLISPLGFTIYATSVFFYGIIVHIARY
jgi:hypothetical protein